jgi:hypothetical protein
LVLQQKITTFSAKFQLFSAAGAAFFDLAAKSPVLTRKSGVEAVFPSISNPKKCVLKERENKNDDSKL